ncbi:MAG: cation:dicarboxylate symporter family transporter, partial [Rhabdochlamydiaceae bacterium]
LPNPALDFSIEKSTIVSSSYGLLTPGNSLYGLFNNLVPGIALFSLLFGLAIMHLKEKEPLLGFLDRVNSSIDRIIKWIAIISPIGIFAHIAHVMGTIHFDDLEKLQLYIMMVIGTTLFLSLWVLPILISCLTSIPLKEIFMELRIVVFLPFATAIPTLALPYINNTMRRLAERKNLLLGTFRGTSQTIIPIGFGFAQIGNFIPLLFIFFLAFFYRHPFTEFQAIMLPFLITLFSIGIPQFTFIALPFLLNVLNLPADGFNLYAEISAITLNFQVLLSTASMLTFMYLVILKYYGLLEVHWKRLFYHTTSTVGILVVFSFIGKNYIHTTDNYHNLYYNLSMEDAIDSPPKVTV